MVIVMCCSRNWYIYLATEIYALLKHNKVKKIYLFIEDDNIPYLTNKEIEFININKLKEYITEESPNYNTQYTKLSYLRCYFTKILKDDKILYVDSDTLIVDNIEGLWNTELEDNVLAGVKEPGDWGRYLWTYGLNNNYVNSGVLLMDLKKIREEKLDDSMIYLLNHKKFAFPDQDVINLVCRNRIKYVSNIYNSSETTGIVDNAKIIHYIRGNKGWKPSSPRSDIWYSYHKEMIGGNKMETYTVKATRGFDDYGGKPTGNGNPFVQRKVNDIFDCTKERYLFLREHGAVELVEIKPLKSEAKPVKEEKALVENATKEDFLEHLEKEEVKEEKPTKAKPKKK